MHGGQLARIGGAIGDRSGFALGRRIGIEPVDRPVGPLDVAEKAAPAEHHVHDPIGIGHARRLGKAARADEAGINRLRQLRKHQPPDRRAQAVTGEGEGKALLLATDGQCHAICILGDIGNAGAVVDGDAGGEGRVEQSAGQRAAPQRDRAGAIARCLAGIVDQRQPLAGFVEDREASRRQARGGDLIEQAQRAHCIAAIGRQRQEQALVAELLRLVTLENDRLKAGLLKRQRRRQPANAAAADRNGG